MCSSPLSNAPPGILSTHLISSLSNVLNSPLNFEGRYIAHLTGIKCCALNRNQIAHLTEIKKTQFVFPLFRSLLSSLNYTKQLLNSILEIDLPLTTPWLLSNTQDGIRYNAFSTVLQLNSVTLF